VSESFWSSRSRTLLLLGRLALAAVFLFAGYAKLPLRQPAMLFAFTIDSYQLLPPWAVSLVAHTLPWFELALGLLLLVGWPLRPVATLASLLLLVFFGVMVRTYARGLEIDCGCFGPGEQLGVKTLLRDGSLLALSLAVTIGAFLRRRSPGILVPPAPEPQRAE
jgi:uncharacterized membrane protein YphA (DoxX/SURF4 family)